MSFDDAGGVRFVGGAVGASHPARNATAASDANTTTYRVLPSLIGALLPQTNRSGRDSRAGPCRPAQSGVDSSQGCSAALPSPRIAHLSSEGPPRFRQIGRVPSTRGGAPVTAHLHSTTYHIR